MGIKTYQEKNTSAMEKELAQSDIPVKRKIQKTIQKYHISENGKIEKIKHIEGGHYLKKGQS